MGWGGKRCNPYSVCNNPKCKWWAWDDKGFSACKQCGSQWAGSPAAKKGPTVWESATITFKGAKAGPKHAAKPQSGNENEPDKVEDKGAHLKKLKEGAESTKALYGESHPAAVELQRIYEDAKAKLEEANAQARQAALEEKPLVDQFRSLQDRLREKKRQFDKSQLDIQSQKERIKEVQKELEEAQEELGRRQSRHGELEKEIRELESTLAVKGAAAAASIPGASIHEGIKQLVRTHLGQLGPEECISSESDLLLRGAADCLWGAIQKVGQQIQESAKRVGPEAKEGVQGQGNGGTPGQLDEQMGEKQSRKLEQHLEQTKQLFERLELEMGDEQKAKRVKAIVEEVLAIALPVADECL